MKTGTRTQVPETSSAGMLEDLAALVAQLLLLVGLVAPSSTIEPASGSTLNAIGSRERRGAGNSTAPPSKASSAARSADLLHLLVELGDAGQAGAGHRLVGGRDHADQPGLVVQRPSTGIAAIVVQFGLAMMPLGPLPSGVRVHLGHHQRHVGVHPPRRRVVDHHGARLGHPRGEPLELPAGGEQDDVEPAVVGRRGVLDGHLAALPRQRPARRPREAKSRSWSTGTGARPARGA